MNTSCIVNLFNPIELWSITMSCGGQYVRFIDRKVLSLIYPVMNSSFFSSVMAVITSYQPRVYTFIPSFIPNMILLIDF